MIEITEKYTIESVDQDTCNNLTIYDSPKIISCSHFHSNVSCFEEL